MIKFNEIMMNNNNDADYLRSLSHGINKRRHIV